MLFLAVLVVGTAGYIVLEGWSFRESLLMTVLSISTLGYRDVDALSPSGQVFTALMVLTGVGAAFYLFSLFVAVIVDGGIRKHLATRRYNRMLDEISNHFIVCGYGRIGAIVVEELKRRNVPYVVIERDAERVHAVIEAGGLAVEADASREEVLTKVGIDRARGLIAAVGTDAENVYAILTARGLRPDLFIIGRAETPDAIRKLQRAGANRVLSPYQIGAVQMAQTALRPAVVDFVDLVTSSEHLELGIEQVTITAGSELTDRSIIEANLRQRFGVIVVGIQRAGGRMEFNPAPEARMRVDDQLVVLGPADSLKNLAAAAGQP